MQAWYFFIKDLLVPRAPYLGALIQIHVLENVESQAAGGGTLEIVEVELSGALVVDSTYFV